MTKTTKKLWLLDNYKKEFDATIIKNKNDYVCLDQTVFYPIGGGQPSDTGFLEENSSLTIGSISLRRDL